MDERQLNALVVITDGNSVRAFHADCIEHATDFDLEADSIAERIGSLVIAEGAKTWHLVAPPQLFCDIWDGLDPRARVGLKRLEFGHLISLFDDQFTDRTADWIHHLNEHSSRVTPVVLRCG